MFAAIRPDLPSPCSLGIEVGLCNTLEQKWFFNLTSNTCEAFNYTGCRGNDNRFDSVTECSQTCSTNRCSRVVCMKFCPFGFVQDGNGCDICECMDPCVVSEIRWHFMCNRNASFACKTLTDYHVSDVVNWAMFLRKLSVTLNWKYSNILLIFTILSTNCHQ